MNPVAAPTTSYPMASLYVGDLADDISEALLFERFSTAGPVLSIRVCRDMITRRSLGYAYVNFQQPGDAERAMELMNFDILKDRPMRIMWSQRDPSLRRSGVGNIFIKNLDKAIDHKSMYDTFTAFGNILSCKVCTDEQGNSKGYGFVHFETEEAANNAISKVNGMLLNHKKVFVGKFIPRSERIKDLGEKAKMFTNVYVKNLTEDVTEEQLFNLFKDFGNITSHKIVLDVDGKSKGFGFVAFAEAAQAEEAVKNLNSSEFHGKTIYVGRAQKKSERQAELKKKFDAMKMERIQRTHGVNLYIKNLDDSIGDDLLRQEFSKFGTITSAKVMVEDGRSRGFGFVCFNSADEATRAVTEMNGRILVSKPLYVALAQRREDRKAQLASQYMDRVTKMRMQTTHNQTMYTPNAPANYYMQAMPAGSSNLPRSFYPQPGIQLRHNTPRWASAQQARMGSQNFLQASSSGMRTTSMPMGPRPAGQHAAAARSAAGVRPALPVAGQQPNLAQISVLQQQQQRPAGSLTVQPAARMVAQQMPQPQQQNAQAANYKYTNTVRNQPAAPANTAAPAPVVVAAPANAMPATQAQAAAAAAAAAGAPPMGGAALHLAGHEPLTSNMLAGAVPQEQKQMLGERLYPMVREYNPSLCGKITGMLLEMDNTDLLAMLEDRNSLKEKMDEALVVLQAHTAKGAKKEGE